MKKSEESTLHVQISTGTIIRVLAVIVLAMLVWFLRDIVLIVLTAIILASAVEPAVHFFIKLKIPLIQKKIPRLLALLLTYGLGATSLVVLVYFFLPAIISDVSQILRMLPSTLDISALNNSQSATSNASLILPQVLQLKQGFFESANILDIFQSSIENGNALESVSIFFGGFLSFILIIVLSFYLSAQERGIENFLRLISPIKSRTYVVDLWRRSQAKIGLWAQGQLMLGVVVGVLVFLIMSLLGIPSALFLAMIAMLFELIPVFGPILAAVPAVSLAFLNGINPLAHPLIVSPGMNSAIIVAGIYFIVQQIESHVIYPEVVRKIVGIPPVLVILSLVIGAKMAGFLGIILSVPITAVFMEFLNDVARERKIFDDNK